MGADIRLRVGEAGEHRTYTSALLRKIVTGAFELGEVARIEMEIQDLYLSASAPPRCPSWNRPSSAQRRLLSLTEARTFRIFGVRGRPD